MRFRFPGISECEATQCEPWCEIPPQVRGDGIENPAIEFKNRNRECAYAVAMKQMSTCSAQQITLGEILSEPNKPPLRGVLGRLAGITPDRRRRTATEGVVVKGICSRLRETYVFETRALVILQEPMLRAEVAVAEPAVSNDPLRGGPALLEDPCRADAYYTSTDSVTLDLGGSAWNDEESLILSSHSAIKLALSMGEARRWSTSQLCLSDDLRLGMHSRMQVQRRMVRGGAGNSNDGPMWLASIGDENALRFGFRLA
ncbi:hypothetical protein CHU98_g7313 [Xylaria longipes]|nr:hypothetical protein CHU98_g7313 [Xylaria longipes]